MPIYNNSQSLAHQRYTVTRYVDAGGMQEVYLAHDTLLGRDVALKVPMNAAAERSFRRSAIASARVNHPFVTRTFDYFVDDRREHLVEEYVSGKNLKQLFEEIPRLDPYAVAHIVHGLAQGMAAVHAQGVIHRDLKPSNIMIEGAHEIKSAKVTDFGIAQMAKEEITNAVKGGHLTITASKTAVAQIPYMAPEVIEAPENASTTSDIWALGAITYELLTGELPYGQGFKAIPQILNADPPKLPDFITNNPQFRTLGTEIFGIILRCLTKNAEHRPSALELVRLCERLCYPPLRRELGTVSHYPAASFGFIEADSDKGTIFFHTDSVYGRRPPPNTRVWFTRYVGSPRDRAHPVVSCEK